MASKSSRRNSTHSRRRSHKGGRLLKNQNCFGIATAAGTKLKSKTGETPTAKLSKLVASKKKAQQLQNNLILDTSGGPASTADTTNNFTAAMTKIKDITVDALNCSNSSRGVSPDSSPSPQLKEQSETKSGGALASGKVSVSDTLGTPAAGAAAPKFKNPLETFNPLKAFYKGQASAHLAQKRENIMGANKDNNNALQLNPLAAAPTAPGSKPSAGASLAADQQSQQ